MIIATPEAYAAALDDLKELADAQTGTPDGYRFDALSEALDTYEAVRKAAPALEPIVAV